MAESCANRPDLRTEIESLLRAHEHVLVAGPSEGGSFDISAVQLEGEHRVIPVLNSAFEERGGPFAADCQWFAYTSNEAGGPIDIFLARLPTADARIRVSSGGGSRPQWNANGKELFYVDHQGRMMSVPDHGLSL